MCLHRAPPVSDLGESARSGKRVDHCSDAPPPHSGSGRHHKLWSVHLWMSSQKANHDPPFALAALEAADPDYRVHGAMLPWSISPRGACRAGGGRCFQNGKGKSLPPRPQFGHCTGGSRFCTANLWSVAHSATTCWVCWPSSEWFCRGWCCSAGLLQLKHPLYRVALGQRAWPSKDSLAAHGNEMSSFPLTNSYFWRWLKNLQPDWLYTQYNPYTPIWEEILYGPRYIFDWLLVVHLLRWGEKSEIFLGTGNDGEIMEMIGIYI